MTATCPIGTHFQASEAFASGPHPPKRAVRPPSTSAPARTQLIYRSASSSPVGSLEEEEEIEELGREQSPFEDAESSSPRQKAASLLRRMKRSSSVDQHAQPQVEELEVDADNMGGGTGENMKDYDKEADNIASKSLAKSWE